MLRATSSLPVPFSPTISTRPLVGAAIAGRLLARRVGGLHLGPAALVLMRVALASVLAWGAMVATVAALDLDVLQLVAGGLAGAVVFVVACRLLRVDDLTEMRRILLRR